MRGVRRRRPAPSSRECRRSSADRRRRGRRRRLRRARWSPDRFPRPHPRHVENIRLELHQELVDRHAAVNSGARRFATQQFFHHRADGFRASERLWLPGAGAQLRFGGISGEAGWPAARVVLPMRRIEAGECGNEIDVAVVFAPSARAGSISPARSDQAEILAQPLHQRAGDRHAAFERIDAGARRACTRASSAGRRSKGSGRSPVFISRKQPVP